MNNLPKIPVRFLEHNKELLKSTDAGGHAGGTDFKFEHFQDSTNAQTIVPQYRYPADREAGWLLFRRYPNGDLDLQYAVQKVVDSIHNVIEGLTPDMYAQIMLSCFYPMLFSHPSVADSHITTLTLLRISELERFSIIMGVHAHLAAESDYSHSSHSV